MLQQVGIPIPLSAVAQVERNQIAIDSEDVNFSWIRHWKILDITFQIIKNLQLSTLLHDCHVIACSNILNSNQASASDSRIVLEIEGTIYLLHFVFVKLVKAYAQASLIYFIEFDVGFEVDHGNALN